MPRFVARVYADNQAGGTPIYANDLNALEVAAQRIDLDKAEPAGAHDPTKTYYKNQIVVRNSVAFRARTDLPARAFSETDWERWAPDASNWVVLDPGADPSGYADGTFMSRWVPKNTTGGTTNYIFPQGPVGPEGPQGPPGTSTTTGGGGIALSRNLSSFDTSGTWPASYSNDDKRLENAFTWAKAQTGVGAVIVDYNASFTGTHAAFEGLKLSGPPPLGGYPMAERSSGHLARVTCTVSVGTGASSFLVGSSTLYGGFVGGIAWKAGNTNSQFAAWTSGTPFGWTWWSLQHVGFKHVYGNPTQKFAATLNYMGGPGSAINAPVLGSTQITLGGSDNEIFPEGCNIGAGGSETTATGEYLMRIDSLGKTNIGPMYFTADNGWRCCLITGSSTYTHALTFTGGRFEGRNDADPSYGALLKISGSPSVTFDKWWFGYAMTNPGAYSTTDLGVIEVAGGDISFTNCTYGRATGVNDTVGDPLRVAFIYQTGGHVAVYFQKTGGSQATNTPLLRYTGGTRHTDGYSVTTAAG